MSGKTDSKKRCTAEVRNGEYVNIPADRMQYDGETNMIFVYNGAELVAAFEITVLMKIYLSEKRAG